MLVLPTEESPIIATLAIASKSAFPSAFGCFFDTYINNIILFHII